MPKTIDAPPVRKLSRAANDAILRHQQRMYLICTENAEAWERDGNQKLAEYWRMRATQYDCACKACKKAPPMSGWEVCQSCAYAIQAYFADGNWHEAPKWLVDYTYFSH